MFLKNKIKREKFYLSYKIVFYINIKYPVLIELFHMYMFIIFIFIQEV